MDGATSPPAAPSGTIRSADATRGPTVRRASPRIDQWRRTWYLLRRNPLGLVGLGIILFLVVFALVAATLPLPWNNMVKYCGGGSPGIDCTWVCTYSSGPPPSPNCYQVSSSTPLYIPPTLSLSSGPGPLPLGSMAPVPSSPPFFFNTWQGILRGADWSMIISVSIVVAGAMIGLVVGAISGFYGGGVDETIMRLVDIFLSIPQLLFVIVTVTVLTTFSIPGLSKLQSTILLLCLAFIVVWWPFYARIVRGQVLVVREQKYVEAARASGAKRGRIIFRHIIPNSMYPVFIQMSLDVGSIPLLVGALSFLGFNLFGVVPPQQIFPEWGNLSAASVYQFQNVLSTCIVGTCTIPWWQFLFPGLMLFLFAISVNLFADGLRDALDPRLRR
ncbi:MAG: ABC transporter permease [Thermoplasmata archaeon]